MNILGLSADKLNYVPSSIGATSVNPASSNPTGKTALEIAEIILGRKMFASVPIEMFSGLKEAKRDGNMTMQNKIQQSLTNLQGSTLLNLMSEAEEGTILHMLVSQKLEDFKSKHGEPIPNYTPFIPPLKNTIILPQSNVTLTIDNSELTHQARLTMMSSWLRQYEIQNLKAEDIPND